MSTHICNIETISLITDLLHETGLYTDLNNNELYNLLLKANIDSVNYRYNETKDYAELYDKYISITESTEQKLFCLECWDYQSCETPTFYEEFSELEGLREECSQLSEETTEKLLWDYSFEAKKNLLKRLKKDKEIEKLNQKYLKMSLKEIGERIRHEMKETFLWGDDFKFRLSVSFKNRLISFRIYEINNFYLYESLTNLEYRFSKERAESIFMCNDTVDCLKKEVYSRIVEILNKYRVVNEWSGYANYDVRFTLEA